MVENVNIEIEEDLENVPIYIEETTPVNTPTNANIDNVWTDTFIPKRKRRPATLNLLGENIVKQIEKNIDPQNKLATTFAEFVNVEKMKLKFEIKFLNPTFEFDFNE